MGFELRREIRDLLPRGGVLTDKECRLILELADHANEQTRRAWPGVEWLAEVCDIPNPKRVGEFFTSIARKWVELRVELGKDRHGRPYYAKSGQRTVYRLPTRAELVEILGADKVPPTPGPYARQVPAKEGPEVPATGGPEVPALGGPQVPAKGGPFSSVSPQSSSSKNSSSLSPRASTDRTAPVPVEDREREQRDHRNDDPINGWLLAAGAPDDRLDEVRTEVIRRNQVRSPGWWTTAHGNGSLRQRVAEVLENPDGSRAVREIYGPADAVVANSDRLLAIYGRPPHRPWMNPKPEDEAAYYDVSKL